MAWDGVSPRGAGPSSFLELAASFNVTDVQFLGQREDSGGQEQRGQEPPEQDAQVDGDWDDLPF